MKLIVGLGNPGERYKLTRHNIGFIFIDEYLRKKGIDNIREKYRSEFAETVHKGEKVFYQKPLTFMNSSGEAIAQAARFYKLDPEKEIFVIYDDMDMDFGKIKIRPEGRDAGHNGIKSIIQHLGDKFVRIKFGIGKAVSREETIPHVLGKFLPEEREKIKDLVGTVSNIIDDIKENTDISVLMNRYNRR